ncbi:MAG: leucyl aminopeptidase, partial [Armatimonadetes bacterium]|nr:leucyl aminopeptidase [Armatimonadota bacterium]NIM23629.1 leucyl aminopeptidase [Armatimonadota bacterium]NIM67496.1 leucyl aminopeptidase [Armatimonadota bacterium]NIM75992.1 leucyl aminopeptidase [Armatimonadota bacterium]NIN05681.1 leucyl aminopeptidase [Armatimonadota bacterium]
LVVGLGKREEFSPLRVRRAAGTAARFLRRRGCRKVSSLLHGAGLDIPAAESARMVVEGTLVGLYSPDLHKTGERQPRDLEQLLLVGTQPEVGASLEPVLTAGQMTAEAVNLARDLGNEPANIMTPAAFAQKAKELAESAGLQIQVLEEADMQRLDMGGLLAVASGSEQPAKLVTLLHKPVEDTSLLTLVGKGITFDSGGISLKPREGMEKMKNDMAGAAAVLAAMWAIARMELPLNVLAVIPLTENLLSGKAFRPGDVLRTMAGKTIEIITTDAEGRLVLADALAYAVQQGATHVVDVATLTGSCAVALGGLASGLFSTDEDLADALVEAGELAGERLWRLPTYPEYKETMESKVADMKNVGGRYGDASNAAVLLREFVGDKPWAHIDIAATDWNEKTKSYLAEGPTGVGVGTMLRLAERMSRPESP